MQVLLLGCLYSPSQHRWDAADPLTRARVCPCGSASPRSSAVTWLVKTNFTSTAPAGASPFGIRTCFAKSTDNENKSQKILLISAVKKKQQLLEVSCTGKTMNWNASMALARPITRFLKLSAKSRRGGKVCLSISVAKPVNKSVKPLRYSRSLSHCSLPWRTRWECIRTEQVKTPILDCFALFFFSSLKQTLQNLTRTSSFTIRCSCIFWFILKQLLIVLWVTVLWIAADSWAHFSATQRLAGWTQPASSWYKQHVQKPRQPTVL